MKGHRIRIVSLFAFSDTSPFRKYTWEGMIPITDPSDREKTCEEIFRALNRVGEADVARLEEWGYELPSLSSGDIIGIWADDGDRYDLWQVRSFGFAPVTPGLWR